VPDKKTRTKARLGKYATGKETAQQILNSAVSVLIEDGYASLSLRSIAENCGMKIGNLSYYFPTKQLLIAAMLEMVLADFRSTSDKIYSDTSLNSEQKLLQILRFWLEDMQTKRGTHLYTELWAMSNHDPFVAARLDEFYRRGQERFGKLVKDMSPSLADDDVRVLTAYITAAMEGVMIFAGHNRPWAGKMPQMAALSTTAITGLIKTMTAERMNGLNEGWRFPPPETVAAKTLEAPDA
jgi:AcrR family transcriptional regulator